MRSIPICGAALLMAALAVSLPAQNAGDAGPSLIYRSEPEYSAEATRARVQASVMLSVTVGEDGKARDIHVTQGAGFGLDEKAIEAMNKWRFNPATHNGQPTAVPANIEMNFTILAKNDKVDRSGQRARLNFALPANASRPELIVGQLPGNPAVAGEQSLRLHLRVDPDGAPKDVTALSFTDPVWEKQVLRVVQTWRFEPAAVNGSPVAAEADFEMLHIASAEPAPLLIEPPANVTTDLDEPRAAAPRPAAGPPRAIPGLIARSGHTATLLPNGTVLLAGGKAPTQVFDWATRRIVNTGSLKQPRSNHTATLLRDGTVLIVGGYAPPDVIASAEIFDPSTGKFAAAGSLHDARYSHIAIALPDGRVLIRGGKDAAARDLSSVEIYNPRTKTFTIADALTGPRAIILKNGRSLFISATADIYDPGRYSTATLLPAGKVLITATTAELYDPATGAFTLTGPMLHPEESRRTVLLNNGKVLVTYVSGSTEIYDPAAGTFTAGPAIAAPGENHTSTVLQDGGVLVTGNEAELLTIN